MSTYKVKFDPKLSRWVIQVRIGWLRWSPVLSKHGNIRKFKTLEEVDAYVAQVGLSHYYERHSSLLAHPLLTLHTQQYVETQS